MKYYPINEDAAKRAKEANSYNNYVPGSATKSYQVMVDEAAAIAARQKDRVDSMYHEKIDRLLDVYARKLAEVINKGNEIDARVPSILITGGSNFPIKKKDKQNAARERNAEEYAKVQHLLRVIRSTGMGGIMSDDKDAIAKLKSRLKDLERHQERIKAANAAIRMKDTAKGDAKLTEMGYTADEIKQLRTPDYCGRVGYPSYELSNNNANIHRIRDRIAALEREAQRAEEHEADEPVTGDGYGLVENAELGRIQFIFDDKPDADIRDLLKTNGFRWAPSQGAWQRMLNDNGRRAARLVRAKLDAHPED